MKNYIDSKCRLRKQSRKVSKEERKEGIKGENSWTHGNVDQAPPDIYNNSTRYTG